MSRRLPTSLLGLLLVLACLAPPATARGGAGAVESHLLEKGLKALQRAERAWFGGDRAEAQRRGREAQTLFRDVLRQAPGNRQAAFLGAQAAVFAQDAKGAQEWIGLFLARSPRGEGDPDLHFLRALYFILLDENPTRALRHLQRMFSLDPSAKPQARDMLWCLALSDLGRRYLRADKPTEAARQFATGARVARRMGDRTREIHMLGDLGTAYMRGDRFIEAAEVYGGLAKVQPEAPLWPWRLGMALANQSRFAEAAAAYREAIALQEKGVEIPASHAEEMAELPLRLGNCLRNMVTAQSSPEERERLFGEARDSLQAFIDARPEDVRGYTWMGVFLQDDLDKPYEALAVLQKAFALDPMCSGPLRRMIQIHGRHPAPEGTDPAAWKRKLEVLRKDLAEGEERRKLEMDRRKKATGDTGCM